MKHELPVNQSVSLCLCLSRSLCVSLSPNFLSSLFIKRLLRAGRTQIFPMRSWTLNQGIQELNSGARREWGEEIPGGNAQPSTHPSTSQPGEPCDADLAGRPSARGVAGLGLQQRGPEAGPTAGAALEEGVGAGRGLRPAGFKSANPRLQRATSQIWGCPVGCVSEKSAWPLGSGKGHRSDGRGEGPLRGAQY